MAHPPGVAPRLRLGRSSLVDRFSRLAADFGLRLAVLKVARLASASTPNRAIEIRFPSMHGVRAARRAGANAPPRARPSSFKQQPHPRQFRSVSPKPATAELLSSLSFSELRSASLSHPAAPTRAPRITVGVGGWDRIKPGGQNQETRRLTSRVAHGARAVATTAISNAIKASAASHLLGSRLLNTLPWPASVIAAGAIGRP